MSLIRLEKIEMVYGSGETRVDALRQLDLEVERGEFIAIMGKSGCGKSTLLNILGAVTKPTGGSYLFDELSVNQLTAGSAAAFRNRKIGFVVQHFALIKDLTVKENIGLPLVYQGCRKKEIAKRVSEVLALLELEDKANCYPAQLSGGQCQRTAIARAVVTNPEIILADEPTGALDEENGKNIMRIFSELNQKGTTILVVTHDKEIAEKCNRTVVLKDGRIVAS
ncbi:MAG: ABC transporter ATP-binding protein [Lachnospiraceae bacterium]|nr:ABC transporter ATP-binding protein [Lachnospiraceae bacterium]